MNKNKNAGYKGKDISDKVMIIRDKNTKLAAISSKINDEWKLYAGSSADSIDRSKPIVLGITEGIYPLDNVPPAHRVFLYETEDAQALVAERLLPLQGGYNFRDLGGIRTNKGKYTRWGLLFRSDDMMNLTQEDLEYLSTIPLRSIVDFRSESEIRQGPDKAASSVVNQYPLSISPGNLTSSPDFNIAELTAAQSDSIMKSIYIQLVADPLSIQQYRRFFEIISDSSNLPLVYHCTAGKDRTGVGTFLFLSALGVDKEKIMDDYLSSNMYLQNKYAPYIRLYPALKPLFDVVEDYLEGAIDHINTNHGSVESYLKDVLHVDAEKLRNIFLY